MCQGEPNLSEVQLALQQLEALAHHLEQSARGWRSHLEDARQPAARLHFQMALHHAGKLQQALHQAGNALALAERRGGAESRITVTPLPLRDGSHNTPPLPGE